MTSKSGFITGGILGLLGVMLGAMGAHLLKDTIGPEFIGNYKTGAEYQMYHSLAIILFSIVLMKENGRLLSFAILLTTIGVVLFSGSLYAMSLTHHKALGVITPFGGLCMMAGWVCFISHFIFKKKTQ